jgi:hypothetical protein
MSIPARTPMPAAKEGTRRAGMSRQVTQQRRGYAQAVLRARP